MSRLGIGQCSYIDHKDSGGCCAGVLLLWAFYYWVVCPSRLWYLLDMYLSHLFLYLEIMYHVGMIWSSLETCVVTHASLCLVIWYYECLLAFVYLTVIPLFYKQSTLGYSGLTSFLHVSPSCLGVLKRMVNKYIGTQNHVTCVGTLSEEGK